MCAESETNHSPNPPEIFVVLIMSINLSLLHMNYLPYKNEDP